MLHGLSIRDIVLIDRLDLAFHDGLCVLTGETGAGKSILLESLGLALGARADSALVRSGADKGSVVAEFDLVPSHPVYAVLAEQDVEADGALLLRRVITADGRSRAYVNDQPVSVGLLRRVGELLVEIHGQNAEQGLLDPANHRGLLDAFGNLGDLAADVRRAWAEMRRRVEAAAAAEAEADKARADEDYLRHVLGELDSLDPQPGEEEELAETRSLLMHAEKIAEALAEARAALSDGGGVEGRLRDAERALHRVADRAGEKLEPVLQAVERAAIEAAEASAALDAAGHDLDAEPGRLEQLEERLFALRAAARKHRCEVDQLAALRQQFADRLEAIEDGSSSIARLRKEAEAARAAYLEAAGRLGAARSAAAGRLDVAVAGELEPLKLGNAVFRTVVTPLEEEGWSGAGTEKVAFEVATNPGSKPGPLAKVASGGELSRFMLALKVVLAREGSAPTLIFDEVDRGVGGATADAVGERLGRLADGLQVLVITHSPQVAARGGGHWRIRKDDDGKVTVTTVERLEMAERREEIARMLAGAEVTEEARAAAVRLMEGRLLEKAQ